MPWKPKKFREVSKDLKAAGFEPVRQKGSHVVFKNKAGKSVTVPDHGGTDVAKGTMRSIAKQAGVDPEKLYGDGKDTSSKQRDPMDLLKEGNPPPGSKSNQAGQQGAANRGRGGRSGRGQGRGGRG